MYGVAENHVSLHNAMIGVLFLGFLFVKKSSEQIYGITDNCLLIINVGRLFACWASGAFLW